MLKYIFSFTATDNYENTTELHILDIFKKRVEEKGHNLTAFQVIPNLVLHLQ